MPTAFHSFTTAYPCRGGLTTAAAALLAQAAPAQPADGTLSVRTSARRPRHGGRRAGPVHRRSAGAAAFETVCQTQHCFRRAQHQEPVGTEGAMQTFEDLAFAFCIEVDH